MSMTHDVKMEIKRLCDHHNISESDGAQFYQLISWALEWDLGDEILDYREFSEWYDAQGETP